MSRHSYVVLGFVRRTHFTLYRIHYGYAPCRYGWLKRIRADPLLLRLQADARFRGLSHIRPLPVHKIV